MEENRANPFGNKRPNQHVERNFSSAGSVVVRAQSEPSLEPEDER